MGDAIVSYCIGLDAHTKTCTYHVKDHDGNVVARDTFPSTRQELDHLVCSFPGSTIVLEASSVSRWIYAHLKANNVDVRLIHPVNIRRTLGRKSDDLDAGFLADAFRLGALRECYVPSRELQELRDLARSRAFLVQERTKLMNRVYAKLRGRGVATPPGSSFAKKNREWLLSQDPEFRHLASLIDHLGESIRDSDRQIQRAVEEYREIGYLLTIPGFGPLTSLVLYAELGDVTRFPSAKHVSSYLGLVAGESQSGETTNRGRITKRGSSLARFVLVQAAWMHIRHCPESSLTKSHKALAKRIGNKKAVVATARKLAKLSYHLLRDKRSFHADR